MLMDYKFSFGKYLLFQYHLVSNHLTNFITLVKVIKHVLYMFQVFQQWQFQFNFLVIRVQQQRGSERLAAAVRRREQLQGFSKADQRSAADQHQRSCAQQSREELVSRSFLTKNKSHKCYADSRLKSSVPLMKQNRR